MPSIKVLPEDASARVGYDQVQDAFGEGAPGTLQIVTDEADAAATAAVLTNDRASPLPCRPCPPPTTAAWC